MKTFCTIFMNLNEGLLVLVNKDVIGKKQTYIWKSITTQTVNEEV